MFIWCLTEYSFLYTRVLSLRPLLLVKACKRQNSTRDWNNPGCTLDDEVVEACIARCVNTAHSLIETIHKHLDTPYKSPGWHLVYRESRSAEISSVAKINLACTSSYFRFSRDHPGFHQAGPPDIGLSGNFRRVMGPMHVDLGLL